MVPGNQITHPIKPRRRMKILREREGGTENLHYEKKKTKYLMELYSLIRMERMTRKRQTANPK